MTRQQDTQPRQCSHILRVLFIKGRDRLARLSHFHCLKVGLSQRIRHLRLVWMRFALCLQRRHILLGSLTRSQL